MDWRGGFRVDKSRSEFSFLVVIDTVVLEGFGGCWFFLDYVWVFCRVRVVLA